MTGKSACPSLVYGVGQFLPSPANGIVLISLQDSVLGSRVNRPDRGEVSKKPCLQFLDGDTKTGDRFGFAAIQDVIRFSTERPQAPVRSHTTMTAAAKVDGLEKVLPYP